jgi:hypothetical protein
MLERTDVHKVHKTKIDLECTTHLRPVHLWKVTGAFLLRHIFAELNSTQSFLVSIELQYVSGKKNMSQRRRRCEVDY